MFKHHDSNTNIGKKMHILKNQMEIDQFSIQFHVLMTNREWCVQFDQQEIIVIRLSNCVTGWHGNRFYNVRIP